MNSDGYISLAEAALNTPYSQEYLSLRARQGKLKAVKHGRNWVTTRAWIGEYLSQVDEAKQDLKTATVTHEPVKETFVSHIPRNYQSVRSSQKEPDFIGSTDYSPRASSHWTLDEREKKSSEATEEPPQPKAKEFSVPVRVKRAGPMASNYNESPNLPSPQKDHKKSLVAAGLSPAVMTYDEPANELDQQTLPSIQEPISEPVTAAVTDSKPEIDEATYTARDSQQDLKNQFWPIQEKSAKPSAVSNLTSQFQPTLAVALGIVVLFSVILLDEPFKLRRNIAAGVQVLAGRQVEANNANYVYDPRGSVAGASTQRNEYTVIQTIAAGVLALVEPAAFDNPDGFSATLANWLIESYNLPE